MRRAYHPKIRFYVGKADGRFTKNGWRNKSNIVFHKKTSALAMAKEILRSKGQVYIKVSYGKRLYNDGIYTNEQDLKEALSAFTEQSLIGYALS